MTSILLCAIPSAGHLAVDDETRCCPNLTFAIAYSNYHTKNNPVSSHFDFDKYNFIMLYLWIVKYVLLIDCFKTISVAILANMLEIVEC